MGMKGGSFLFQKNLIVVSRDKSTNIYYTPEMLSRQGEWRHDREVLREIIEKIKLYHRDQKGNGSDKRR